MIDYKAILNAHPLGLSFCSYEENVMALYTPFFILLSAKKDDKKRYLLNNHHVMYIVKERRLVLYAGGLKAQ